MFHGAGDMKDDVMGVIMKVIWRCVRERANPRSGEFSSVAQRPYGYFKGYMGKKRRLFKVSCHWGLNGAKFQILRTHTHTRTHARVRTRTRTRAQLLYVRLVL